MATVIETVQRGDKTVLIYDNGMERDASNGRMLRPPTAALITTTEKSNELQRRRRELKQDKIMAGANAALGKTDGWDSPQDLDFVEALAEVAMMKALNPDDPKQIEASKFLITEAGLAHQLQRENADAPPGVVIAQPETLLRMAAMIEAERSAAVDRARAVDVDATDIRSE